MFMPFSFFLFVILCQGDEENFILKSCTRRKTDSIEKRFCFDVEAVDRSVSVGSDCTSPLHILDNEHSLDLSLLQLVPYHIFIALFHFISLQSNSQAILSQYVARSSNIITILLYLVHYKTITYDT